MAGAGKLSAGRAGGTSNCCGLEILPNFAGSSCNAWYWSVTVFGRAGKCGSPQQGVEGLKIQSRRFKSIVQMSIGSHRCWPGHMAHRLGMAGAAPASPLLFRFKSRFNNDHNNNKNKKKSRKNKAKSERAAVTEVGPSTREAQGGEAPPGQGLGQAAGRHGGAPSTAHPSVRPSVRPSVAPRSFTHLAIQPAPCRQGYPRAAL